MLRKSVIVLLYFILAGSFCFAQAGQSEEPLGDTARRIRAEKQNAAAQPAQEAPAAAQTPAPSSGPEASQDDADTWEQMYDRGEDSMMGTDYVGAEKIFRDLLDFAQQHNLPADDLGVSNDAVGWSLMWQRRYDEAEVYYRNGLQIFRGLGPEAADMVARTQAGLGITLVGLGRYPEAEGQLTQSLNAYHQRPQATMCELAAPLDGLAMLYKSTHEYRKGQAVYTEAFALMTEKRGTPCAHFVTMLDHLAELYADNNEWESVEKIQQGRAALTLGMKGPHSEMYGDAVFAIAATLQKRQRFQEAAATFAQAAEVYRSTDPPAQSKLASSLQFQEINLQMADKAEDAEKLHAGMVAAVEGSKTDDARGRMMALRADALEARRNGNLEQAAQLIGRELTASQSLTPADQIIALQDSDMIDEQQHKLAEAESDLKRIRELSVASTGPSSGETAHANSSLGRFYLANHRLAEAENSYSTALALYGPQETKELKMDLTQLGLTYIQESKYDRAEASFQKCVKLAEATQDGWTLTGTLQFLAMAYQKDHRPNDAELTATRAMNVSLQLPKPMNQTWAGAALTAAEIYEKSGRPQQAEQLYAKVITFLEQELGADSASIRLPLDKLITLLKSEGRLSEAATLEARRDKLPPMPKWPGMTE